ncbi:hypothetical protein AB4027_06415 [Alkalibacterium putridalgicola]|uniref:hypothetical protein n=1 Tax=Alkalibacterium putridalgicola TaxID=426703 RepID=UPI0034CD7700
MFLDERINHVHYALDRREALLRSKIDRRFPVSIFVVYRRVSKVEEMRDELDQIKDALISDRDDALERLDKVEETLFGAL